MAINHNSKRNRLTFQWRIENFSFCWQVTGEYLQSPVFRSDLCFGVGTKWNLRLYPRGKLDERFIGCLLHRDEDSSSLERIEIYFKISFLLEDQLFHEATVYREWFKKGEDGVMVQFMKREDLFTKIKATLIPQGTLTVCCEIWIQDMKNVECPQLSARTVIKIEKMTFTRSITAFSSLEAHRKIPFKIRSASKRILATLRLFLAGECSKETVCVEINFIDSSIRLFEIHSCILDERGKEIESTRQEHCFHKRWNRPEYTLPLTKRELIENKARFLPKDALFLKFECTISLGIALEEIERTDFKLNSLAENHSAQQKPPESSFTLKDDLKSVYDEGFLCDVKLRAGTDTFPVHKLILSARSPVFKSMFGTDMKEKNSGCVNITDVDSQTLRRLLLYIYTDTLDDLEVKTATELYEAADKYSITNLKEKCSTFLKGNLKTSNACGILVVADMHQDEVLKVAVQDYISEQECVFRSKEWKHLMENYSKLTSETMFRKITKM
ncbi:TD and POZ domain-containing protein 3 [Araneus ventricosus]|uniref:TD and POZ domain-containing protein 3 n=1 Tax=Araneus ventricosus TaxID=182803 RepID=A0A4Y2EQE1_ARAVE|nr:TD and POZ domain-containing protein 3 [Araneus ventricosus]